MATIKSGKSFSGMLGNLIYYQRGETQCIRIRPDKVRQPNTPAQVLAREKFRRSAKLARYLNHTGAPVGSEAVEGKLAGNYQRVLSLIRNFGFMEKDGLLDWNWSGLLISNGSIPDPVLSVQKNELGWVFSWDKIAIQSDQAVLVLLSIAPSDLAAEAKTIRFSAGNFEWNPEAGAHVYAFCAVPKGKGFRVSRSVYLGEKE